MSYQAIFIKTNRDVVFNGTTGKVSLINQAADIVMGAIGAYGASEFTVYANGVDGVYASATATCASVAAADTVTIKGQALTAQDLRERQTVTCGADVAGSLNSTYFLLYPSAGGPTFYVWLNINSAGVDPALTNKIGIQATAATGANSTTIATAIKNAINAQTEAAAYFKATSSTNVVTVQNIQIGAVTAAADGTAATGFAFAVTVTGANSPSSNKFGTYFAADTTTADNTSTAASLVDAINNTATTTIPDYVNASYSAGVVTISSIVPGKVGNLITLTSSNGTRLAVTGSGFLANGAGCSQTTKYSAASL